MLFISLWLAHAAPPNTTVPVCLGRITVDLPEKRTLRTSIGAIHGVLFEETLESPTPQDERERLLSSGRIITVEGKQNGLWSARYRLGEHAPQAISFRALSATDPVVRFTGDAMPDALAAAEASALEMIAALHPAPSADPTLKTDFCMAHPLRVSTPHDGDYEYLRAEYTLDGIGGLTIDTRVHRSGTEQESLEVGTSRAVELMAEMGIEVELRELESVSHPQFPGRAQAVVIPGEASAMLTWRSPGVAGDPTHPFIEVELETRGDREEGVALLAALVRSIRAR